MTRTDTDILPATEVKRRLLELLKRLDVDRGTITITRNGVPAGVLMSVDEYDSLIETLEILADARLVRELATARRSFARGDVRTHEEVWGRE